METYSQAAVVAGDDYRGASYLTGHPAVLKHITGGVSLDDLVSYQEALGDYAKSRLFNNGYGVGGRQAFEGMSFDRLLIEMTDELADSINYLTMASIKVLALYGAISGAEATNPITNEPPF